MGISRERHVARLGAQTVARSPIARDFAGHAVLDALAETGIRHA